MGVYGGLNNDYDYDYYEDEGDFVISSSLEEEYNALHFSPDNMYGSPYGGYARATRSRLASLPLRLTTTSTTTTDSYYTYRDGMGQLFACHSYPEQQLTSNSIRQSMFAPAIEKQSQEEEEEEEINTLDDTTTTALPSKDEKEMESSSNMESLQEEEEEELKKKKKKNQTEMNKKAMNKLRGLCSQIHMGWWSYEWCHEASVTQFHVHITNDEVKVESTTNLGDFNSRAVYEDSVLESYTNGAWCDEANTYRSTIIDFTCCSAEQEFKNSRQFQRQFVKQQAQQQGSQHEYFAIIQQLDETKTCKYHIQICTDVLCQDDEQSQTIEPKTPLISKDSSIRQILQIAFGGQLCLYIPMGWWTYEFCYGKHIRQYHETAKVNEGTNMFMVSKESEQEHFLGYHDPLILDEYSDKDEPFFLSSSVTTTQPDEPSQPFNQVQLDIIEKVKSIKAETSSSFDTTGMIMEDEDGSTTDCVFVQEYTNGEVCEHPDVTDSIMKGNLIGSVERSTTIRYSCGSTLEIQRVQEDTSCHYVMDITVPELCHHPNFQTPHVETNVVKCIPIDTKTLTSLQEEEEQQP